MVKIITPFRSGEYRRSNFRRRWTRIDKKELSHSQNVLDMITLGKSRRFYAVTGKHASKNKSVQNINIYKYKFRRNYKN